ncbi:hypothetical protein [Nocardia sp. NPDC050406]|uniref:hypothetical protein n=1 Tax=Nocardia sp. NPDC050406 TaxID=3364318 RepID=UPI0037B6CC65
MGIADLLRDRGLLAIFAAILLVIPVADCALVEPAGHAHVSADSMAAIAPLAEDTPPGDFEGAAHCEPHAQHYVKAVPPVVSAGVPHLPAMPMMVAVILTALAVLWAASGGVRGPPLIRVRTGRMLLAHFCIDRR